MRNVIVGEAIKKVRTVLTGSTGQAAQIVPTTITDVNQIPPTILSQMKQLMQQNYQQTGDAQYLVTDANLIAQYEEFVSRTRK
jgi:hypothetical protein